MKATKHAWPFLSLSFFVLMTHPAFAKDIGVCVEIVEHAESDNPVSLDSKDTQGAKTHKKEADAKTETQRNSTDSSDSDENGDKSGASLQSEETIKQALNSQGPEAPESLSAQPSVSETPDKMSSGKNYADSSSEEHKALAAARSSFELSDSLWDHELDILPYGQTALVYLKRLFEHFVTHEQGYASTTQKCEQTITVELYPLKKGWTAFARYSGTNREERVDQLLPTELSQFAERAVLALLHDVPISTTIKRDNVLSSDSNRRVQQVKGSNHFTLNIGTKLIGARVNQMQTDGENAGGVEKQLRIYHPMKFGLGYRGRFENWGLEVQGGLGIGMGKKAASSNPKGGHIDYGGDTGLAIHFLNYRDPRGLVSFYLGGGAGFDLVWFNVVNSENASEKRSNLFSGGLSADGVFGWEFLRAASVQFFIQGEINLPLYICRTENDFGTINSWMPGVSFKLGVVF
ncbi:MAG: hypothetical protein JXR76_03720 [Deltaproteobacteria bacterium]|nr:hypothetical protein [Deltaproteobacteria bacterium]